MVKSITTLSGGMDSTTLAYELHAAGYEQIFVSYNYGQRHSRELLVAMEISYKLGADHRIIDLRSVGVHLKGSALTSGKEVKDGHYTDETAKATVVPNRNAIMLNIAWGIAVAEQANIVATAVHAGDHYVYPDCQPEFISEMNAAMRLATMGFAEPTLHLHTPYLNWSKADIVRAGSMMLNAEGTHVSPVPYGLTWSCYRGEDMACGKCPTCVERLEAFWLADRKDPLAYMDRTWWQTVSKIFPDLPEHDRNANIARDYFIDTRESV